jgi:hypothetical protein
MYSSVLVQLSWLLLLFSSLVQCQFFGPNAIAAQLELLRAQGRPIPFFQEGLLSTAVSMMRGKMNTFADTDAAT